MTERYCRRPRTITILDAIADPQLFGQHFRDHVTWAAWCVLDMTCSRDVNTTFPIATMPACLIVSRITAKAWRPTSPSGTM
jgi:hypothetical protein